MDILFQNELYMLIKQYIAPEMLILVPVLLFLGWMMKSTPHVQNWLIPYINTLVAILFGMMLLDSYVDGLIQGILVSAMATLTYNLYQQWNKKEQK